MKKLNDQRILEFKLNKFQIIKYFFKERQINKRLNKKLKYFQTEK